ncbi:hypothetical protein [Streptomyces ficellus]|uniref:Uncharacterized protein n=1 Tax=Streptomyces ficellus TaxID=1977088 RepID=A0A6I6F3P2_9ACTN|nr:hypothetical protein [Streptomyces ficellus]QGV77441.1 hypothetical protein EIZ62_03625 [Streptomyces ficellus]
MNPYAVLAAAAAHWDRVAGRVDGPSRERLAVLLADVRRKRAGAAGEGELRAAAEAAARVLQEALPEEFGGAGGTGGVHGPGEAGGARLVAGALDVVDAVDDAYLGFRVEDLAVLLVDGHRMVGPVLGPVRDRLLAVPAVGAETVRGRGGDPYARELIRLRGAGGAVRLPAFQFSGDGLPWLVVLEVNALLGADRDPWGAADWWLSGNAWLGTAPAELLGTGNDRRLVDTAGFLMDGE